jgi:ribosomal protein L7/L12
MGFIERQQIEQLSLRLTAAEERIEALIRMVGGELDRYDAPSGLELPLPVRDALHRGKKILAIKLLREATGLGLSEAKDAVERSGVGPG